MSDTISRQGSDFLKEWQHAQQRVQRAKSELNSAECNLISAANALIKWCAPADAQPGEKFGVWCRDENDHEILIEVQTEMRGFAGEGDAPMQSGTVRIRPRK